MTQREQYLIAAADAAILKLVTLVETLLDNSEALDLVDDEDRRRMFRALVEDMTETAKDVRHYRELAAEVR